jgi:hypothetical protein
LGTKPKLKIAKNEDDLKWKMISTFSKWNISAITDWIFFTFETVAKGTKLKLEIAPIKMTTNGRQPPMEDDLKILKVKYLINH